MPRVIEIEKIFLYLCYHDGGILDISAISKELDGIKRKLIIDHLDLFEVKYQDKKIGDSDLKGLRMFMEERDLDVGYAITRNHDSLTIHQPHSTRQGHLKELINGKIICIPACLACYWMS